jgi:CRISPR-associated protein Csm1
MEQSAARQRLEQLKRIWLGKAPAEASWLPSGIAIEGDFAGIQAYVLRPVPGAKGAAKRLRARSFAVANRTHEIANRVCREFAVASPFYVAGGRFLICAPCQEGWESKLATIQASIDAKLFEKFDGEIAFHLAGAAYDNGGLPADGLLKQHGQRRARPHENSLIAGGAWQEAEFFHGAGAGWHKCPACLRTVRSLKAISDEEICEGCFHDVETGGKLALGNFGDAELRREELLHHFPRTGSGPATFEDIAEAAAGKPWLGHLRIDADNIGRSFGTLEGDPGRTWGLSRLLHTFFCQRVQELIEGTLIYPVYGGGDDLYVIGPWNEVLHLAVRMQQEFDQVTEPQGLTFSAGFALGKPHQHILTKSDEAAEALDRAKKKGKNRICAMGAVSEWREFRKVLRRAGDVLRWHRSKMIPAAMMHDELPPLSKTNLGTAFLQDVLQLSEAKGDIGRGLWKPLLNYQFTRNVQKPDPYCERWVKQLLGGGAEWARAPLVIRYVLLAANTSRS